MCFAGFLDFFLCFLFLGGEEETDESEVEIDSSEEDEELTLLAFFFFSFLFLFSVLFSRRSGESSSEESGLPITFWGGLEEATCISSFVDNADKK